MVQCAWCYGKLQGWEQGDNPLKEHARHFASCPKFGNRKAVNASSLVNVHNNQSELSFEIVLNLDIFDKSRIIIVFKSINIINHHYQLIFCYVTNSGESSAYDLSSDDLGILTIRPCNPQFSVEAIRLESFRGKWPTNLAQTPNNLSSAGFYYVGN